MKWCPQSDDYRDECLVSNKYEADGILLTSGRVFIKDALIQDGYEFLASRKRIHYEKRNVLVSYLDIQETYVKYKFTFGTFLNVALRVLPVIVLTLCLIAIAFLSHGDSLPRNVGIIYTITLFLLFGYLPYYFTLSVFKDGTFKSFYSATLFLIVRSCDEDPEYVIEKNLPSIHAEEIHKALYDYMHYCWRIRNGIPDKECIKLFSMYSCHSPLISELGMPLGRSTSVSGLVEIPEEALSM